MKSIMTGVFVAVLAVAPSTAWGQDTKAETDVKALDAKLTDAFKTHDFQTLGKHMADDYILIDPRGAIHPKAQYLKHLADGAAKVKDLSETDVKAMVHGDTAVVTGLLHVKGKVEDKEVSAEYRWSRVYFKKGNEWVCALEQHTYVVPKDEKK